MTRGMTVAELEENHIEVYLDPASGDLPLQRRGRSGVR
jgi:hypothetical protein